MFSHASFPSLKFSISDRLESLNKLFDQSSVHCPSHPTSRQRRLAIGWKNTALVAQIKTEEGGGSDALLSVRGVGATVNTESCSSSHLLFSFYQPASPLCSCYMLFATYFC